MNEVHGDDQSNICEIQSSKWKAKQCQSEAISVLENHKNAWNTDRRWTSWKWSLRSWAKTELRENLKQEELIKSESSARIEEEQTDPLNETIPNSFLHCSGADCYAQWPKQMVVMIIRENRILPDFSRTKQKKTNLKRGNFNSPLLQSFGEVWGLKSAWWLQDRPANWDTDTQ